MFVVVLCVNIDVLSIVEVSASQNGRELESTPLSSSEAACMAAELPLTWLAEYNDNQMHGKGAARWYKKTQRPKDPTKR